MELIWRHLYSEMKVSRGKGGRRGEIERTNGVEREGEREGGREGERERERENNNYLKGVELPGPQGSLPEV